jgi:fermentation-respiration switch protein FrsA (DUF1100 family)
MGRPYRDGSFRAMERFPPGGANDQHTLPESTQALFDEANQPKELWLVAGAAHVDMYGFAQNEYAKRLLAFISRAEERRK